MPHPKLTPKQIKFIAVYSGNATEAARLAGYKGNDDTLKQVGSENLAKHYIKAEIKKRMDKTVKKLIATREERQTFWTEVMKKKAARMNDRLKASELLGKSEADFTDKHEVAGPAGGPVQIETAPREQLLDLISDPEAFKALQTLADKSGGLSKPAHPKKK